MKLRFVLTPAILAFIAFDQGSPLPGSFTRGGSGPRQAVAVSPRFGPQPANLSPTIIKASLDYGRLPLYFIANEGQLDRSVAYYVGGKDKSLYFSRDGITIALASREAAGLSMKTPWLAKPVSITPGEGRAAGDEIRTTSEVSGPARWTVKLDFLGANPDARPVGEDRSQAAFSYFRGKPENWHAGVPAYAKILYRDLWPGIDLAYYGNVNELKYELIVHPGSDPRQIRLAYRGVTGVKISDGGQLEVRTPAGGFRDGTPVAYQEIGGRRLPVDMAYSLLGPDAIPGHEVPGNKENDDPAVSAFSYGFKIGDYDHTQPLVLDPAVLVYCGFLGGSGEDQGHGIDVDASGCAYVIGQTTSTEASFPVAAGPDLAANGGIDAFVAKLNPMGNGLVYCGFIGGSADDYGRDVAVDGAGNAYFTGYTYSTEATFPVLVGPDLTHNLAIDTFVGKLDPSGTTLSYCGYIGGWGFDYGQAIAVDGSGNAYLAGYNSSTNFPVTVGPDLTFGGGYEAFVAKVNPPGSGFVYCGVIGGRADEWRL